MISKQNRSAGFNLIELILAMGIFGTMIMGISTALVVFKRTENFRRERLERGIDYGLGEAAVLLDLSDAAPSFGALRQPDDANLNFYDYYPDVPDTQLTTLGVTAKTRELTLTATNSKFIKLMIVDRVRRPSIKLNPPLAFNFTGGNATTTASASYAGINNGNIMVDRARAGFWREGAGMLLMSPAFLRPILPINQTTNYAVVPRTHTLAGFIQGDDVVSTNDWGGAFIRTYSIDTSQTVDTAEKFMWWLPVIGGAGVYALAVPVQYVQLQIERVPDGNDATGAPRTKDVLVRYEWDGTQLDRRFILASNVKSVTFRRSSISSPLIAVSFVMLQASM